MPWLARAISSPRRSATMPTCARVMREKALQFGIAARRENRRGAKMKKRFTACTTTFELRVDRLRPHQILAHQPRRKRESAARSGRRGRSGLAAGHRHRFSRRSTLALRQQLRSRRPDAAERLLLPAIERDVRRA